MLSSNNTAWVSTEIDGMGVQTGLGALSGNLGVGFGPLDISLDIHGAVSSMGSVDMNDTYTSYDNYPGHYARIAKVSMDGYRLVNNQDFFHVSNFMKDYVNIPKSGGVVMGVELQIVNAGSLAEFPKSQYITAGVTII